MAKFKVTVWMPHSDPHTRNAVSSILLCSLLAVTLSVKGAAGISSLVPQEDSLKGGIVS